MNKRELEQQEDQINETINYVKGSDFNDVNVLIETHNKLRKSIKDAKILKDSLENESLIGRADLVIIDLEFEIKRLRKRISETININGI